jgi:hypothetical protein
MLTKKLIPSHTNNPYRNGFKRIFYSYNIYNEALLLIVTQFIFKIL